MDILSGITSLLGGGITGLVGTVVSNIYTYKSKKLDIELEKQKYANEIELKKVDAAIMQQEWTARTAVASITADAQVETEDSKAFAASLTSEPQRYATGTLTTSQNWLMVLLDAFKGAIRPALTLYLAALTTMIYLQAHALIGNGMPIDQAAGLVGKVIDTVLYLTTTVVLWWFGSRAHKNK